MGRVSDAQRGAQEMPMTEQAAPKRTATLVHGRFSLPEPQIEVTVPTPEDRRRLSAALHQLAAAVELATPARERWLVQIEHFSDTHGRVYLELMRATPEEAARGMAVLNQVAG
jgi:hypothetical protein